MPGTPKTSTDDVGGDFKLVCNYGVGYAGPSAGSLLEPSPATLPTATLPTATLPTSVVG